MAIVGVLGQLRSTLSLQWGRAAAILTLVVPDQAPLQRSTFNRRNQEVHGGAVVSCSADSQ